MTFDFYIGSQAEQFSFIRIPKLLLLNPEFRELSIQAKMLYAVLLDRMSLSVKNHWVDDQNRVYIIYQVEEIVQDLGFTKRKAMDVLTELEQFGLVARKRRGRGLPNYLYVKNFLSGLPAFQSPGKRQVRNAPSRTSADCRGESRSADIATSHQLPTGIISASAVKKQAIQVGTARHEMQDPTLPELQESSLLEVQKSAPLMNKTDMNNTDMSKTKESHIVSNPIVSECRTLMGYDGDGHTSVDPLREQIRTNISYTDLKISHPNDGDMIDGIVELILEIELWPRPQIIISGPSFPTDMVLRRFMQLREDHIAYVIECVHNNTTQVRNVKKYLLAALFNAKATIESYYDLLVQHDMAGTS